MSETLEVYGHPLSQPSRTVETFCKLSKIPYKFIHVEIFQKEHLTDSFSKINPYQEIPVIIDSGFNL
jgi:Glutathione S-transferase